MVTQSNSIPFFIRSSNKKKSQSPCLCLVSCGSHGSSANFGVQLVRVVMRTSCTSPLLLLLLFLIFHLSSFFLFTRLSLSFFFSFSLLLWSFNTITVAIHFCVAVHLVCCQLVFFLFLLWCCRFTVLLQFFVLQLLLLLQLLALLGLDLQVSLLFFFFCGGLLVKSKKNFKTICFFFSYCVFIV